MRNAGGHTTTQIIISIYPLTSTGRRGEKGVEKTRRGGKDKIGERRNLEEVRGMTKREKGEVIGE